MNTRFVEVDVTKRSHLDALLIKENDTSIRHLIIPKNSQINEPVRDEEGIISYYENSSEHQFFYLIEANGKFVGDISLMKNPSHLLKREESTGWIGIALWDREYWGKGIAEKAMQFLEDLTIEIGFLRMELGVFEFNTRAHNFYKKCGFVDFSRIENFTEWNGRYWDDIRMEKYLKQT